MSFTILYLVVGIHNSITKFDLLNSVAYINIREAEIAKTEEHANLMKKIEVMINDANGDLFLAMLQAKLTSEGKITNFISSIDHEFKCHFSHLLQNMYSGLPKNMCEYIERKHEEMFRKNKVIRINDYNADLVTFLIEKTSGQKEFAIYRKIFQGLCAALLEHEDMLLSTDLPFKIDSEMINVFDTKWKGRNVYDSHEKCILNEFSKVKHHYLDLYHVEDDKKGYLRPGTNLYKAFGSGLNDAIAPENSNKIIDYLCFIQLTDLNTLDKTLEEYFEVIASPKIKATNINGKNLLLLEFDAGTKEIYKHFESNTPVGDVFANLLVPIGTQYDVQTIIICKLPTKESIISVIDDQKSLQTNLDDLHSDFTLYIKKVISGLTLQNVRLIYEHNYFKSILDTDYDYTKVHNEIRNMFDLENQ